MRKSKTKNKIKALFRINLFEELMPYSLNKSEFMTDLLNSAFLPEYFMEYHS